MTHADKFDTVEQTFVGSSRAPRINLPHVHARSDAPLSAKGIEDNEFLAERSLSVLVQNILLREHVKPMVQFVADRSQFTMLDPIEYPKFESLLHSPITGVMHEITQ
ncbi:MAG TPA: hypothetical protein VMR81_00630 [Patescibacteria group bacterium]|nr:hypothetical protein [Patescibacteria group bacterium]